MVETCSAPNKGQSDPERNVSFPVPPKAEAFLAMMEMGRTDGISPWLSPAVEYHDGRKPREKRGLVAVEDIPKNTLVAIKHLRPPSEVPMEEVDKLRVGYQHSDEPNSRLIEPDERVLLGYLVTLEPIDAGAPITVDLLGRDRGQ